MNQAQSATSTLLHLFKFFIFFVFVMTFSGQKCFAASGNFSDRLAFRIGTKVYFEKNVQAELQSPLILNCYFENPYLLLAHQKLEAAYDKMILDVDEWPGFKTHTKEVFYLLLIHKLEQHLKEAEIPKIFDLNKKNFMEKRAIQLKNCGNPDEFQKSILAIEFFLRDRFALFGTHDQATTPHNGSPPDLEKFLYQFLTNIYNQYPHYIYKYVP